MGEFDSTDFSEKQASMILDLISKDHLMGNDYKAFSYFTYGGLYFEGDYIYWVKRFVLSNTTGGDFYVWLIDNVRQFKEL